MIKWLLMTSLAGSIASLCLIFLKTRLSAKYGGRWYYYVCLSSLLLFIVPLSLNVPALYPQSLFPETVTASFNGNPAAAAETTTSEQASSVQALEQPAPSVEGASKGNFPVLPASVWIIGIWISGFAIALFYYFFSYFRFKRKALQGILIDKAGGLNVLASDYVHSPMLIGFIKPQIVFPQTNISAMEYQLALTHELIHHKQKDAWLKLFAVIVNCLHWFNPVSYLALANISEACEYAVDETVSKTMKPMDKKHYSEMILHFAAQASPAFNSGLAQPKKQLYRRFKLIMNRNTGKSPALSGILFATMIAAVSLFSSSVVFAKAPQPITEYSGGIRTYYDLNANLEKNIKNTLGISKDSVRVFWGELYIDKDGLKIDYFNRTEPYYKVAIQWMDKNSPDIAGMTQKTFFVENRTITVAFADKAAAYKDDKVIKNMITRQIAFELNNYNKDQKYKYDHAAFTNELIQRGAYVFNEILAPEQFAFELSITKNEEIVGYKPITAYDKKSKLTDIFNKSVKLPKSVYSESADGSQGLQIGKTFVMKSGETLALDIKETTDKSPTVSLAILDETTGAVAYWYPAASSGMRYMFTPGKNTANHSFKIVASGEEEDAAKIEVFTYKSGEEETKVLPFTPPLILR
ncbi:M56 family metallopeptidase [Paenibacillus eucommiae]|uniref:Beta-lactamase regulating signal transducer with metallopeptidase domain n=1 Tax=Paenibacillus eucommiae TaxID=1355755 RepID=A0ABS4J040_9BACL|nr:M56 family metallopeptidase [Paenibacillus eucommiae]MBP1993165.1 beta-lactamase regulating signal transducer with metallopeptidase domain [Paenibacillus eucommiae]